MNTRPDNHRGAMIAQCMCGACRVQLSKAPGVRFLCHCTICQKLYGRDYADVTVNLARNVEVLTPENLRFATYKAPPAVNRGLCKSCDQPVIGFMKTLAVPQLAFMQAPVLPQSALTLRPSRHVHYATRIKDIADDLPKTHGEMTSTLILMPAIIGLALRG